MQTYTHTYIHASKHTANPTLWVGNDVPSHHSMRWQWCAGSTMCGISFAKEPYSRLFRKRKFLEWSSCIPPPSEKVLHVIAARVFARMLYVHTCIHDTLVCGWIMAHLWIRHVTHVYVSSQTCGIHKCASQKTSLGTCWYCCQLCPSSFQENGMGWLRLVGYLKLWVSFAEYRLFYTALLQKRPMILRSPLIVAAPYSVSTKGKQVWDVGKSSARQWYFFSLKLGFGRLWVRISSSLSPSDCSLMRER